MVSDNATCIAHQNDSTPVLQELIPEMLGKLSFNLSFKHEQLRKRRPTRFEQWAFILPIRHLESVNWIRENLNVIALAATFLAAVQTQAISFSSSSNTSALQSAAKCFFFSGMFLDVLGGCTAFIAVAHLQNLYTLLLRRSKAVASITSTLESNVSAIDCPTCQSLSRLRHDYQFLEILSQRVIRDPGIWAEELQSLRDLSSQASNVLRELDNALHSTVHSHMLEYTNTADELHSLRMRTSIAYAAVFVAPFVVVVGVSCFVIGGLCFVKDTQPVAVWVSSFAVVLGTLFLFGFMIKAVY